MDIKKTLKELMLLPGCSGHEQRIAWYLKEEFIKLGLKAEIDVFGNVIASKKGTNPDAPSIMVFAHMDSLGLIVRKIDDQGYLRVERLGGVPEKVLPALEVQVETRDGKMIPGYITVKSKHVTPPEELAKVDSAKDLFIDIGVTSKQEALDLGVEVGSMVVYKPNFVELNDNRIYGTTVDNRMGCTIVLGIADKLSKIDVEPDVYFVTSVQEEFSIYGASVAAQKIHPKMAVCFDVANDHSAPKSSEGGDCIMGKGPVISKYNFHGRGTLNGTLAHPKMVKWMEEAAKQENIPLQYSAVIGVLTDLTYVQYVDEGVAALDMCVASRNLHSPVESLDLRDIDMSINLVSTFVKNIKGNLDLRRW